jgi:DNA-binding XRE family transcriptional regulator
VKVRLESTLKTLRRRKRWSQAALGRELGVSQQQVSRLEHDVRKVRMGLLERWTTELGGYLHLEVRVSGERALTDAAHAALQNSMAAALRDFGWIVEPEVSFNHFGDRGRVDLLATHRARGILLVVEVKSRILDVQDILGRLDVKTRVARGLAAQLGWRVNAVVPMLVVREDRTSRRRVAEHDALFARFELRGRAARAWIRATPPTIPRGILLFDGSPPPTQRRGA